MFDNPSVNVTYVIDMKEVKTSRPIKIKSKEELWARGKSRQKMKLCIGQQ